jgi:hypothetical protein
MATSTVRRAGHGPRTLTLPPSRSRRDTLPGTDDIDAWATYTATRRGQSPLKRQAMEKPNTTGNWAGRSHPGMARKVKRFSVHGVIVT